MPISGFFILFHLHCHLLIKFLAKFSHYQWLAVFHWSLSDSKSPEVSKTLLSTLANLGNAVVWMVLILFLISNSFSLSSKTFRALSSAPITIHITDSLIFHSFLVLCQGPSTCLSFCFLFLFSDQSEVWNPVDCKFFLFLLITISSSFLEGIRFVSILPRGSYTSDSQRCTLVCPYIIL